MTTELQIGELIETDENREFQLPTGSEVDCQIATARQFPRSMKLFRERVLELVATDYESAAECTYKLPPRDGKVIEGASARFAEIITYCFGNCRVASRIVEEGDQFVKAQGMFWDLESNTAKSFEVSRSIVDKYGNRYKPAMIATTATAAGSIALRTATLRAIPKPIWQPLYLAAVDASKCKPDELEKRRAACIEFFESKGIGLAQVLAAVGVEEVKDITPSKLSILRGYVTAVRQGEATLEEIFTGGYQQPGSKVRDSELNARFSEPKPPSGEPVCKPDTPWLMIATRTDDEAHKVYHEICNPDSDADQDTRERCQAAWNRRQGLSEVAEANSLFDKGAPSPV